MRVGLIISTVLTLFFFLLSFFILAQPIGQCDPADEPLGGVAIQGAHIVSAGAYFRFWMFNDNPYPVNVTINGADPLTIPSRSSINYDVIAPQISWWPYKQVTYEFSLTSSDYLATTVDFTVIVLNSSFVQIFNLLVPILIIISAIVVALVAVVVAKRRRSDKKT